MSDQIAILAALAMLVAIAGVFYPFRPFRTRKRALLTVLTTFVIFVVFAPKVEQTGVGGEAVAGIALDNETAAEADLAASPELQLVATTPTAETTPVKPVAKVPSDDEIAKMRSDFAAGRFARVVAAFRTFASKGYDFSKIAEQMETSILSYVRPLPASDHFGNLEGYKLLAAIRPENPTYTAKIKEYEDRIREACRSPLNGLRKKYDKVSDVTFYQHPNEPKYLNSRSTAYLYIGQSGKGGRPYLRMKVQYTAREWLFVRDVYAWHDGIKEPLISGRFKTDNNQTIWEWVDESPNGYQIEVLRSLANSKEAILRFEGMQYRRDVTLSAGDKKAIRDVLAAYEAMTGKC